MSPSTDAERHAIVAAGVGLLGLAAAMGIGRFAFTPLLPLMQERAGLSLAAGGWLAAANYAGYLAGALACIAARAPAGAVARWGLAGVALSTLAMGASGSLAAWLAWRFVAGVCSALVLVGTSAWALGALAAAGRPHWAGWVFAGVGGGIVVAGATGMVVGLRGGDPATAWVGLGTAALLVTALAWRPLSDAGLAAAGGLPPAASPRRPLDRDAWLLIACYGAFGFGYIIPATFLPALAREAVADPAVFGWVWPAFGAAAAVSTLGAAFLLRRAAPRRLWAVCQLLMAAGVAAPLVHRGVAALLVSAVAIGGTFVVLTMVAIQEARQVVAPADAPRLIAVMTAAFALGQMLGPVAVAAMPAAGALELPSAAAALLLFGTGLLLLRAPRTASMMRSA